MNKKELILANILIIALMVFAGILTFNTFSNAPIEFTIESAKDAVVVTPASDKEEVITKCSVKPPLSLVTNNDRHILQLQKYQRLCNSYATNTLMVFTAFPSNNITAKEDATYMTNKLKEFAANKITPIVIVEPYAGDEALNYKKFLTGSYDWYLDSYFSQLKKNGITDEMMGTWVPFPESNTPNWNNKDTEPRDFALCVNRYLALLRKTFPQAKTGILLNATTYDPNDLEWNNGDYLSLVPYVQEIDPLLIDSFGIQGFPWVSSATMKRKEIFKASEFLQMELAVEAARVMRVKDIWINAGTFASKYTNDPEKTVQISLVQRRGILNEILNEAVKTKDIQLNEYRVSINLFSEDKSTFEEATDWSYFQNEDSEMLLKEFLNKAEKADVPVALYDMERGQLNSSTVESTPRVRPTYAPYVPNPNKYQLFPTRVPTKPLATITPIENENQ